MIPPPKVVVAIAVVVATVVVVVAVVGGDVLPGECGDSGIATAANRVLYASACPNQGCKRGEGLDAE